jgi:hypothetical protein
MRWSKALSAAVDPVPMAMTICLYGTVVQSPAATTPGALAWERGARLFRVHAVAAAREALALAQALENSAPA